MGDERPTAADPVDSRYDDPGGLLEQLKRRVQVLENQRLDVHVTLSDVEFRQVHTTKADHTARLERIETAQIKHGEQLVDIKTMLSTILERLPAGE